MYSVDSRHMNGLLSTSVHYKGKKIGSLTNYTMYVCVCVLSICVE